MKLPSITDLGSVTLWKPHSKGEIFLRGEGFPVDDRFRLAAAELLEARGDEDLVSFLKRIRIRAIPADLILTARRIESHVLQLLAIPRDFACFKDNPIVEQDFDWIPKIFKEVGFPSGTNHERSLPVIWIVATLDVTLRPASLGVPSVESGRSQQQASRSIFLVHGHNHGLKDQVARLLERLGLDVTVLHEQPDSGRAIIEKFEQHSVDAGFAVVLLTADDEGRAKSDSGALVKRARQNAILEQGYFIGRLGRDKVCALVEEGVEVPSDLSGVLYKPLDAGGAWKTKLAQEIKAAGIEVDLNKIR